MNIQPLGEQIIIRTIPVDSVGSIVIPDSAKGITMMGEKGAMDAVHAVEAEVIATGPGKRLKGDARLVDELAHAISELWMSDFRATKEVQLRHQLLYDRARNPKDRVPMLVKPGDRILYHPAVQKFDRDITDVMQNGQDLNGSKYFIIREDSVLAVIDREG